MTTQALHLELSIFELNIFSVFVKIPFVEKRSGSGGARSDLERTCAKGAGLFVVTNMFVAFQASVIADPFWYRFPSP